MGAIATDLSTTETGPVSQDHSPTLWEIVMPDLKTSLAKSHISKGRPFLNTDGASTVVRGMHIHT